MLNKSNTGVGRGQWKMHIPPQYLIRNDLRQLLALCGHISIPEHSDP